jgi:hypothetical protein
MGRRPAGFRVNWPRPTRPAQAVEARSGATCSDSAGPKGGVFKLLSFNLSSLKLPLGGRRGAARALAGLGISGPGPGVRSGLAPPGRAGPGRTLCH